MTRYRIKKIPASEYMNWANPRYVARNPWFVLGVDKYLARAFPSHAAAVGFVIEHSRRGG